MTLRNTRRTFLSAGALLPLYPCLGAQASVLVSDTILLNGDVHAVDRSNRRAQAVAVKQGRITAVGLNEEILSLAGKKTRRFDLEGRTVLPGINDSHLHLLMWGLSQPPFALDLTYPKVTSIADVVAAVGRAAKTMRPGEWIIGRGWDQPYLAEARPPTAADLDAVSPDNPVALTEFSGHAMWANSLALKAAGIGADTVPPPGGVIVRDDAGRATGLLFEGAGWMLRDRIPPPTSAQQRAAIRHAMGQMLKRGITSVTDPRLDVAEIGIYLEIAADEDQPRLRMNGLLGAGTSAGSLSNALQELADLSFPDPKWMQVTGVKIMGDGIPTGNKTAWMNQPYVGGGYGSLLLDGDSHEARVGELNAMVDLIHDADLQIGAHMTGSRAIDVAVAAYERAQRRNPRQDPRHYIIHADLASEATLAEMAALGVGGNFNPEIKFLIADGQILSLGPARAAYEWPYRAALDAGVVVASSSDAPVTSGNWLQGIATCMERRGKQSGKVSGPEQRISLDEAIRTYTWAGAWQDRAEHYKGWLAPGMVADLCVVDGQLDGAQPSHIPDMGVYLTMVDGDVVHIG